MKYKSIILLIFVFYSFAPISTNSQGSYQIELSHTTINLNYNTTFTLKVNVSQNGELLLNDVFFSLENIEYDIGENQFGYGNGTYQIIFSENATKLVEPNNYNAILTGEHQGNSFSENLNINISTSDTTNPILTILSPSEEIITNSTQYKLVLTLEDEVSWLDINVNIAGEQVIYLRRTQSSLNLTSTIYNQTYLYLEVWVLLNQISGTQSSVLTIIGRDSSYNDAVYSVNLDGDYIKPNINWMNIENNQISTTNRKVEISWEIIDDSDITEQNLYLENRKFLTEGLEDEARSISFILPVDPNEGIIVFLELEVIDEVGNWNKIGLEIIYNVPEENSGFFDAILGNDERENDIILPLILLGITFIGLGVVIYHYNKNSNNESSRSASKLSKINRQYINKSNHEEERWKDLMDALKNPIPSSLSKIIGNWFNSIPKINSDQLFQNELNFFVNSMELELQNVDLDQEQKFVINMLFQEFSKLSNR